MARKHEIIGQLREAEIVLAQGGTLTGSPCGTVPQEMNASGSLAIFPACRHARLASTELVNLL